MFFYGIFRAAAVAAAACVFAAPAYAAEITVVAAGDVYLGGRTAPYLADKGPLYPFAMTRDIVASADVAIVNLECPLTESNNVYVEKKYKLKAAPSAVESLKAAGIDAVTLANNHMMDFGPRGLADTLLILDREGIAHAGAGGNLKKARRPAVVEANGAKVAILSYSKTYPFEFYAGGSTPGTAPGEEAFVRRDVVEARKTADIVVAVFHWGGEGLKEPRDYQRALARAAINSGALLVVGHHPHVTQPVEVYNGGLIFYSLGNFVFGTLSGINTSGALARVTFEKSDEEAAYSIKAASEIPLDVNNLRVSFSPVPLKENQIDLGGKGVALAGPSGAERN